MNVIGKLDTCDLEVQFQQQSKSNMINELTFS